MKLSQENALRMLNEECLENFGCTIKEATTLQAYKALCKTVKNILIKISELKSFQFRYFFVLEKQWACYNIVKCYYCLNVDFPKLDIMNFYINRCKNIRIFCVNRH